jgi:hypothetical protein
MSTINIIKQFNEIMGSFLSQISPMTGTNYHYKFTLAIRFNSAVVLESFLVYALPFRDKILKRDESYFISNDLSEVVGNNSDAINEVFKAKTIYEKIDDTSRKNMWDILQALLILGEDYIKVKQGAK